jgi:hypothetical protein
VRHVNVSDSKADCNASLPTQPKACSPRLKPSVTNPASQTVDGWCALPVFRSPALHALRLLLGCTGRAAKTTSAINTQHSNHNIPPPPPSAATTMLSCQTEARRGAPAACAELLCDCAQKHSCCTAAGCTQPTVSQQDNVANSPGCCC